MTDNNQNVPDNEQNVTYNEHNVADDKQISIVK